ncbi:AAA family ATPase [Candidatus Uabimicrobium sp. HlEnr_7]|uniref:McrB family protein n=1 Tax=Candidatus Uabimicrobium helgolandensis TaxID=3095367 RepID=UPI003557D369
MEKQIIEKMKYVFKQHFVDFKDFNNPGQLFYETEENYKREASKDLRNLFAPYVEKNKVIGDNDEAKKLIKDAMGFTNFLNWRDQQYIEKTLFSQSDYWLQFANLVVVCLKSLHTAEWPQDFNRLLLWLNEIHCKANISKLLSTYFLFLWSPEKHIAIKPDIFDRFLTKLEKKKLGRGKNLTISEYQRVLAIFDEIKQQISDWNPKDFVHLHTFYFVVRDCDISKIKLSDSPIVNNNVVLNRNDIPLNLILAGPPGTGKTHKILSQAILFKEQQVTLSKSDYMSSLVENLTWFEVCALALIVSEQLLKVKDLKESDIVQSKVSYLGREKNINAILWATLQSHTVEECEYVKYKNRSQILVFEKNEESCWSLVKNAQEIIPDLYDIATVIKNYQPEVTTIQRYEFVTFHQSYSYEDFVEGIKPVISSEFSEQKDIGYDIVDGIFKKIVKRAIADPYNSYSLFIDEINRGNIANIFGELITVIEANKRMTYCVKQKTWINGVRVKLPYSQRLFGVPDNLHIIGTMNTADRSIALLDTALRRRFSFYEFFPKPEILNQKISTDDGEIDLAKMLTYMNNRIEFLLDRDHTIGHAYFVDVKTFEQLEQVFRNKVLPLLQEYFYNDWQKIQMILADLVEEKASDGENKSHEQAIIEHEIYKPKDIFGYKTGVYESCRIYHIAEELSVASFQKIYNNE